MMKPTGNSTAPSNASPVWTVTVTAKAAPSVSVAPAMNARISVSLVDMKIFASPASTILVTNSLGARSDIGAILPSEGSFGLEPELLGIARDGVGVVARVLRQQADRPEPEPERAVPLAAVVEAAEVGVELVVGQVGLEPGQERHPERGADRHRVIAQARRRRGREQVGPAVERMQRRQRRLERGHAAVAAEFLVTRGQR